MFRFDETIITQINFANNRFLANASIVGEQTEIGILTKPNNVGYTAIMLDYLNFQESTDNFDNDIDSVILDYVITQ